MPLSLGKEVPCHSTWLWQAAFGLNLILQSPFCLGTSAVSQSPWGQAYIIPPNDPKKQKTLSHYTHIKKKILKTLIARINMVVNEDALISQAPLETQDKEGGHSAKSPGCSYHKKEKACWVNQDTKCSLTPTSNLSHRYTDTYTDTQKAFPECICHSEKILSLYSKQVYNSLNLHTQELLPRLNIILQQFNHCFFLPSLTCRFLQKGSKNCCLHFFFPVFSSSDHSNETILFRATCNFPVAKSNKCFIVFT